MTALLPSTWTTKHTTFRVCIRPHPVSVHTGLTLLVTPAQNTEEREQWVHMLESCIRRLHQPVRHLELSLPEARKGLPLTQRVAESEVYYSILDDQIEVRVRRQYTPELNIHLEVYRSMILKGYVAHIPRSVVMYTLLTCNLHTWECGWLVCHDPAAPPHRLSPGISTPPRRPLISGRLPRYATS